MTRSPSLTLRFMATVAFVIGMAHILNRLFS